MSDLLLVYITCESVQQAKSMGKELMEKRLCACINIFPSMQSAAFWPPKTGTAEESNEVVLIAKTTERHYKDLEAAVQAVHTYDVPCIIAIPTTHVSKTYYDWIVGELDDYKTIQ